MDDLLLVKLLEAHRTTRHDILNHLQVISGYLQIGQPQRAHDYTMKAAESIRRFQMAAAVPLPRVQSLLIWFISNLTGKSLALEITNQASLLGWEVREELLTRSLFGLFGPLLEVLADQQGSCCLDCSARRISIIVQGSPDSLNTYREGLGNREKQEKGLSIEVIKKAPDMLEVVILQEGSK